MFLSVSAVQSVVLFSLFLFLAFLASWRLILRLSIVVFI
jgi:hypothetical protein